MMKHRGAPAVHAADEPAGPEIVRDVLDRRVRGRRARLVVHREDDAGRRLDDERGQRRRAERLEPVDVARDVAEEEVADRRRRARALLEPVERVQDLLLAGCGRAWPSAAGRHQRGAGSGRARTRGRRRAPRGTPADPLVDLRRRRRCPRPRRPRTALAEEEVAVADRERVAVERAHGRARDAVPLGVVLAAVARAAEARRLHRDASSRRLYCVRLASSWPFGWTGQPRCAQWFEMIVKLGRLAEERRCCGRTPSGARRTPCFGIRA